MISPHHNQRRHSGQKGQTLIIFALMATFLVGIAGVAIEGGLLEADRRFAQAVSDGAALAGANKLPSDATAARKTAVDYAIAGLNAGVALPLGCDPSPLYTADGALPLKCDPSPSHTLTVTTPYNGNSSDILVRLDRTVALNLAAVVGFPTAKTASRSVARGFTGGQPFGYALYAANNLTTIGNVDTNVSGNVYVQGCIEYNNADNLIVTPSVLGSEPGDVQVYDKAQIGPQTWNSGSGTGCTANVVANTGASQWGAGGHTTATENCGPLTRFKISCPSSQQPVPMVPIPAFVVSDKSGGSGQTCVAAGVTPGAFTTTFGVAIPGCYSACVGGKDVTIPNGTLFLPGTYAFVGTGVGGCDVIFAGSASNSQSNVPGVGDGSGGVTFILYNGTSMCGSKCGTSNASGTITLNAPNVPGFANDGILVYSCASTCGQGSGNFDIQGPSLSLNLTGLVYNPGGDCTLIANATQNILGQLICNNVDVQGGAVSAGSGIVYGGSGLPIPLLLSQLIQ